MNTDTKKKLQAAALSKEYFAPATTAYHSWDSCAIPPAASFITRHISNFTTTGSGQFHTGPTFSTCYAAWHPTSRTTTSVCSSLLSSPNDEF
jgi:hypothetical protein